MKKILLLVIAAASACSLNAQQSLGQQVSEARLKMLKATVEFLAKDSKQFKKNNAPCTGCDTLPGIKKFITDHGLTKVGDSIDAITKRIKKDATPGNWEPQLNAFKAAIDSGFFFYSRDAQKDRSYRKKILPAYANYQNEMKAIIAEVKPPAAVANIQPETKPADNKPTEQVNTDTTKTQTATEDPPATAAAVDSAPLVTPLFLYIVIGVLAGLCLYLFYQLNNYKKKFGYLKNENHALKDQIKLNGEAASGHKKKITELNQELETLYQERQNLEELVEKNRRVTQVAEVTAPAVPDKSAAVQTGPAKAAPSAQPQQPTLTRKYAYSADGGDGFMESSLLDQPNNEAIFEITISSPDTATFAIAGNANVQQYALSNIDFFLRKTCQYDSFPSPTDTRIKTDISGKLRKEGGKWIILSAAKISFS